MLLWNINYLTSIKNGLCNEQSKVNTIYYIYYAIIKVSWANDSNDIFHNIVEQINTFLIQKHAYVNLLLMIRFAAILVIVHIKASCNFLSMNINEWYIAVWS